MGRQLFACARLAEDKHPAIGRGHKTDLLAQGLHGNTVTDDHAAREKLFLQIFVFASEALSFDCILDQDQSFFEGERLLQEIESAQLGGAHRSLNGAVAGNHDHFGSVFGFLNFL